MKPIFTLLILSCLFSCEVFNVDEDIPSMITIESIEVEGNYTSKISDAWIYIDNEFQGVFPLPANFPILKTGQQDIIVEGGIKKNGISSSRVNYPYFTSFEISAELLENQNLTLNPKVNYSFNNFPYDEDFEGVGTSLSVISDSTSHTLEKIYDSSNINFGNYYAKSVISGEFGELFECNTPDFDLPKNQEVYLEMDYKCNSLIVVGIYANGSSAIDKNTIIYLNQKDDWNKIYISLTEIIANYSDAQDHKLFFAMPRDTSFAQNEMFLDNIKLVYEE
jgi:hypothetical protein